MTIKESAKWLNILLQLERKPIGIKFLLTKEDYDAFPATENKNRMSYCTVVRRAGDGLAQKIHKGHSACIGGAMALGLCQRDALFATWRIGDKHSTYLNH